MAKQCAIYETMNSINEMKVTKSDGLMTLSGVFGVCGVRNNNQRVYEAGNYGKMVAEMKKQIQENGGVPGELEHPQTMNITLENVSHKVTDINIDENGVVTGTIQLLNTPKGKIAQAIVEGGLPLFVSSRATGQVDKSGRVTLEKLSAYDLVGSPGFSQARMHLNESQVCESISDNIYIISEKENNNEDMKDNHDELTLEALAARIEALELENEELRKYQMTNENLKKLADGIQKWIVEEYSPEVEKWVTEEFAPDFTTKVLNENKKVFVKEIAPKIQQWVTEEFAPEIEKWIVEEYSPEVEKWIVEHYSPEVENWVLNQFAPGVQNWMVEHFAPTIEGWLTECYSGNIKEMISEGLKNTKAGQLKSITETLNLLESLDVKKPVFGNTINENRVDEPLYIANMPESARVQWNMASNEVKESIQRRAKLYDFTNEGSIERFWESIKFEDVKPAASIYEGLDNITDRRERAIRESFRRRRANL